MEVRKIAFIISGLLILTSVISLVLHGGPRYSVDFRGGTFMEVRFEDKENPEKEFEDEIQAGFQLYNEPISKV